ncbi:hypothetical protein XA68_15126 [Ophiocordyceps unilateralis]|uniref:LPXTG-motif cell wall anchor domain protein n=1 Tax=Ophiocordyceps unilateralis TaxID=268505 RepID=A0A2A9P924_OPHUN|nr:hypothetical protein XA68_15126 [Ophiocordyceps unilateralis]
MTDTDRFKPAGRLGPAATGASAVKPSPTMSPFSSPQGSPPALATAVPHSASASSSPSSDSPSSRFSPSSSSSSSSSAFTSGDADCGHGADSIIIIHTHPPRLNSPRHRPAASPLPSCRASTVSAGPGPDPAPRQAASTAPAADCQHDSSTAPSRAATPASTTLLAVTAAATAEPAGTITTTTASAPSSSLPPCCESEPPTRARWASAPVRASAHPPPQPTPRHAVAVAQAEAFPGRQPPLLLERLARSDDLALCRPPVSTPVRVPPIRAFRSSSSRRGRFAALDMNLRSRPYGLDGHRYDGSDDTTLRALEGRDVVEGSLSRLDDPADVFLRIAKDESPRRVHNDSGAEAGQSSLYPSAGHRRPLSTVVTGNHVITSPPQPRRRLSDHQDRPRSSHLPESQAPDASRIATYRFLTRDKAPSNHPGDDSPVGRSRAESVGLRPASLIVRSPQVSFQEPDRDGSTYTRRRSSITDSQAAVRPSTSYATSGAGMPLSKTYNPSPLVRVGDSNTRPSPEQVHGLEGTDSTASTAGPSTVWDELDDIKSRIHRLELTGKLPSSSGTTGSRMSDERPATANTTVTSMSPSPKRQGVRSAEATVMATSPKEAHSVLNSTLAKMRPLVSADIFRALESAAQDAIGLSTMMGSPGQLGPISSGASTIGPGNTVTDRQLRRKADGVCRSLTELCVALGEGVTVQPGSARSAQPSTFGQLDGPSTPTLPRSYSGLPAPRRSSIAVDTGLTKSNSSPRVLSRLEERRNNLLNGTSLPSPRLSAPPPSESGVGRRSSLAVGRTRRTGAEDDEDGRSTILRSRRAGTEEPDEGRRSSLLVRNRRGTVGAEADDTTGPGAPSRAVTQFGLLRGRSGQNLTLDTATSPTDPSARPGAGTARRHFVSSTGPQPSRLAALAGSGSAPPRRYLERSTMDHDGSTIMRSVEDQPSRPPPLSQGISHMRASSLSAKRQARESVASPASPATLAGTYR